MPTGDRRDPYAGFNFLVEIDGITRAAFSECSGLSTDSDPIEYRDGSDDITVRKIPGLKKFANISLKRGMTKDMELWKWRKDVLDGKTQRKAGSVVLLNEARDPALRWNFREGWPTKWEGPSMNATGNETAVETLEIAHEGLELETA
jgi:phage tail-like protein